MSMARAPLYDRRLLLLPRLSTPPPRLPMGGLSMNECTEGDSACEIMCDEASDDCMCGPPLRAGECVPPKNGLP